MIAAGSTLQLILDLVGVSVFALSGALLGLRTRLDVFGIVVLAMAAGLGGGMIRDVLIGDTPPPALADWRYISVPMVTLVAFLAYRPIKRATRAVRVSLTAGVSTLDALGLGVFAVAGTAKAVAAGLGATPAIVLGVITGVGGGMLRDTLAGQVPVVLQRELYALPAAAGAGIVMIAANGGWYGPMTAAGAALFVFAFRIPDAGAPEGLACAASAMGMKCGTHSVTHRSGSGATRAPRRSLGQKRLCRSLVVVGAAERTLVTSLLRRDVDHRCSSGATNGALRDRLSLSRYGR